jgi:hypothetical protein
MCRAKALRRGVQKTPFCRLLEISSSDTEGEKLEQHSFRENGLSVPSNNANLSPRGDVYPVEHYDDGIWHN